MLKLQLQYFGHQMWRADSFEKTLMLGRGEGNGTLLQYSCLENPRDGRAWWAAIYGVAQSRTRPKWLSSNSSSGWAGGDRDNRGWDGWVASPTQWAWVWVNSGCWWWTGRPGVLQAMGSKELDMTEQLNWTELNWLKIYGMRILGTHTFMTGSPTDFIHTKIWEPLIKFLYTVGYVWIYYQKIKYLA